jgi:hypothetical protein
MYHHLQKHDVSYFRNTQTANITHRVHTSTRLTHLSNHVEWILGSISESGLVMLHLIEKHGGELETSHQYHVTINPCKKDKLAGASSIS